MIPALADFSLIGGRGLEALQVAMPGVGAMRTVAWHGHGTRPDD